MKLVATLLTLLLIGGCSTSTPVSTPTSSASPSVSAGEESGQPSPTFNLTSPDGSTVAFDPSDNPDKDAFLLLFWSYRWDPNVETFLERASELHERYAPRGLVIIAVSYDEEPTGLRKYLEEHPVPFEVAVGVDSTYRNFKVSSIPTSILVNSNGEIVDRWTGYYTAEELADRISTRLPGRSGNSVQ